MRDDEVLLQILRAQHQPEALASLPVVRFKSSTKGVGQ